MGIIFKAKITEFLFNEKKYRLEKFGLLLFFCFVYLYLGTVFGVSLYIFLIPFLALFFIISLIKILWYNKKEYMKTRVRDWIEIILCFIVISMSVFLYMKENKLENAVYDVIEEKVGNESFTIDFIDESKSKEDYLVVGYTIEGDLTIEWYDWRDGELIHVPTEKMGNDNT